MNNVGKFIEQERKKNQLSQRELAEKCNISNTELWNIENGKRTNPNPIILNKIAIELKIPSNILLEKARYININNNNKNDENNGIISSVPSRINFIHEKKLAELLSKNIIEELNIKYNNELDSQVGYKIGYRSKIDTICFSKYGDIIGIEFKFINASSKTLSSSFFINQLQRNIKSIIADFYFHFKNNVPNDDKLTFLCIFILDESIEKNLFIDSIEGFFRDYKSIFEYKLFYKNEIK